MRSKEYNHIQLHIPLDEIKGSVNNMLVPMKGNKKRMIYSKNYRGQKQKIEAILNEKYSDCKNLFKSDQFTHTEVQITYHDRWLTKLSNYTKFRKKDTSNFIKVLEDCISKHIGIDDSTFTRTDIRKAELKSEEENPYIIVSLTQMDLDTYKFHI